MAILPTFLLLFFVCLAVGFGPAAAVDKDSAGDYQADYADAEEIISLKRQLDNNNKRMIMEMGTLRDELATMRKDFDLKIHDGEVNVRELRDENKKMAIETSTLRGELTTLRQNCDMKIQRLQDEVSAVRADFRGLKQVTETSALGLWEATRLWNSTTLGMISDFDVESTYTRAKISELEAKCGQTVNVSSVSTALENKINQNVQSLTRISNQISQVATQGDTKLNNLQNELTTTKAQVDTFGTKLLTLDRSCDEWIRSLNTTVQIRAAENDLKFRKLANETAVIRSLELGIGSINATLNRMLGLEEPNRWPETDSSINATFRRSGPLKLVVSSAKLPTPRGYLPAVYDGKDSIYIIGGYDGSASLDKVLKYSLLSGTVEITTTFLKRRSGSAIMDGEFITYFGGLSAEYESGIYRISPTKWGYSHVGSLPAKSELMGVAWDHLNRTAYLFGGSNSGVVSDQILSYSAATHQITQVGRLPEKRHFLAASWDSKRKVAHLFSLNDTWQFTPPNIVTSHKALPYTLTEPCSVYASANDHVYVFGGSGRLIKYNPTNHMSTLMDVQMWPWYLEDAACVYVPKQHRMYIFGGWGWQRDGDSNKWRDEITFIDLDWP